MSHEDEVLSATPEAGDYILAQSGSTWIIQRHSGDGTARTISTGDTEEVEARTKVLKLATDDASTAWQLFDLEVYRLLQSFRPSDGA